MKRRTRGGYWVNAAALDFGYEIAREHFYNRLGRYTYEGARLLAMAEVFEALYSQGIEGDTADSIAADVVADVIKIHRVNTKTAAEARRLGAWDPVRAVRP